MTGHVYLALDTATDAPSLALGTPDSPGDDVRVANRRELSRDIELLAARLLEQRGIAAADLSGLIVSDGPGSFTGLRIGIAFAKGLCRALGLPLFAAPSLLGAAFAASGGQGIVLAEYDALRGDVYRAAYRFTSSGVDVLLPPAVVAAGSPVSLPAGYSRAGAAHASATSLLALSRLSGAVPRVGEPARWEPVYGRPAEAEARYRAQQAARGS